MRRVAESFGWPFRGAWRSAWAIGLVTVLFVPLLFIPLLGYSVAATRSAENDPASGPPRWRFTTRLLVDGLWMSFALLLIALPYAIALNPLAGALRGVARGDLNAHLIALFVLALPWGLFLLLVMPHATARFAATGRPRDLLNLGASIRAVRDDFTTWNAVVAAMVTAWAVAFACVGLLCVGIVPGIFYAILVSAHAAAALHRESPRRPAG